MKRILGVITLLVVVVLLVACAPANSDKAKAKMEKAGYTCAWYANKEVGEDGQIGYLGCTKGNTIGTIIDGLGNGLTATLYDSAAHAKAAFNDTKDAEGKTSAVLAGKWVLAGSEEAIKAFKK
ncbi:MAG: hypothetical protein J6T34_04890 [Bacilli bacterium]|nr:hypothetical protein [Bacilli bacterium]